MFITSLIKKTKELVTSLDISQTTLDFVRQESDLITKFFLEICPSVDEPCVTVDLSLLLLETEVGKCTTWNCVLNCLNAAVITNYKVDLPEFVNPKKAVRVISPLSESGFILSYLNMDVPEDRDIKQFRDSMKDLGIKNVSGPSRFKMDSCLCSVNGMISRPVIYNDEMLIKDGAKFMWSTTELYHPNLMLLDFSDFGGFDIIPFSECEKKFKNYNNHPDFETEIKMILPESIDLCQCTVFPVVNHTLFFPENIKIVNKRTIIISPGMYRIHMSMLKKAAASKNFLYSTFVYESASQVKAYVEEEMFSPSHFGAFFVVVKNPNLWISKVPVPNFVKSVEHYSSKIDGILFEKTTQSVMDSTVVRYDHIHDYYRHPLSGIFHLDSQNHSGYVRGMESVKCEHEDSLRDFSQAAFEIIKIVGK